MTDLMTDPATPLGGSLQLAAQLLLGGLDCTAWYVRQNGYDTHAFQAETHGLLLQDLGDSLAAFWRDLEAGGASKRVVVLVWSEFGRRLAENGSKGTDHGAASCLFVAGPSVRGGVVGTHPSLKDLDDGDLKHHTDFRRVYATLLDHWLGCDSLRVLGAKYEPVEGLKVKG